jgi:ABC-type transport system involved in multi-copper enzyme maturation permease subunit
MIKYIAMDFRRLFKTRSFYIAMIIALLLLTIYSSAAYFFTGAGVIKATEGKAPPAVTQMLKQARQFLDFNHFASIMNTGTGMLHLILAAFAAAFISKDHHSGYLKNLYGIRDLRFKWLVSKLAVMMTAAVIYYLVYLTGAAIVTLLYGNALSPNIGALAAYYGMHLSVDLALFGLIILTVTLVQTKTAAVIVALLLSFNLQAIIYLIIDQFGWLPFELTEYGMMGQASRLMIAGSGPVVGMMARRFQDMMASMATAPATLLPVSLGIAFAAIALSWLMLRKVDYRG